MRPAVLLLIPACLCGQALGISPASVGRGSANIFRITLNAPKSSGEQAVTALQWRLIIPPALHIAPIDIVTGDSADSAGKFIRCASRALPSGDDSCTCIVAGGLKPIPEGTVAVIKFSAARKAKTGTAKVLLDAAAGVSAQLQNVPIPNTSGTVTIR
jgi:hypothetical protein